MKNVTPFQKERAVFRFRVGAIINGKRFLLTPWRENLILDTGLNKAGTFIWPDCFKTCLFGDKVAPTEVRRDSGGTTFTTVGVTCTASSGFFVAGDVGRLIKFNDGPGQERYITGFTSATVVTLGVAPNPVIAAQTATIWYVNQTALEQLNSSTTTYGGSGGDNGTSDAVNVRTMKRTYIGAAVGGVTTLTEIGFSDDGSNVNIFDRDIIPGGVALGAGDQPFAVGELIVTFGPSTPLAVPNVGTGFDASGTFQLANLNGFNFVGGAGNSTGNGDLSFVTGNEAWYTPNVIFTQDVFNAGSPFTANSPMNSNTLSAYGPGNFYRDKNLAWSISQNNGTIYGLVCNQPGGGAFCASHLFTTPFVKAGTQTLSFILRRSWQRALVN